MLQLFEESRQQERVADLAVEWFLMHGLDGNE
mgnify:CR=1 FL=1